MAQFFLKIYEHTLCGSVDVNACVGPSLASKIENFHNLDAYVICNGKKISHDAVIEDGATYHICERIYGGKGGFGSMLRAIGAQIDKTTNRDACRDLSGRRMRDVNNEKNLREWVAKKAERERERNQRRKERRERMLAVPLHKFEDPKYDKQKVQVQKGLTDALTAGLARTEASASASTSGPSRKRKAQKESVSKESIKKACDWLGVNVDDLSDVDFSSDSSGSDDGDAGDSTGYPGLSSLPTSDTGLHSDSGMGSTSAHASSTEDMIPKEQSLPGPSSSVGSSNDRNPGSDDPDQGSANKDSTDKHALLNQLSKIPAGKRGDSPDKTSPPDENAPKVNTDEEKMSTVTSTEAPKKVYDPIDLEEIDCAEKLQALGLDHLKSELMQRGLKCGGTLQERVSRLFSVKGLSKDKIDPSLFAKPAKGKGKKK